MTKCRSCGRNTRSENNEKSPINGDKYCAECSDIQGNLLPFSEVLENFANYFMNTLGYDIAVSRNAAMEILKRQPAWEPMFKKEEKMRNKKRVFAIVAGALALVLAVTGVVYGFYRYFGTPTKLFLDKKIEIKQISQNDLNLKELVTNRKLIIQNVLYDKNIVFFCSWDGGKWQNYMYDLEKEKGYCLPSSGEKYSYSDGDSYVWIEESFDKKDRLLYMKLSDIIYINGTPDANISNQPSFNEMVEKMAWTIDYDFKGYNLKILSNYIIWEDTRNFDVTGIDIYAFDLDIGKEFPICNQFGNQSEIQVAGGKIFWQDERNTIISGYELYYYDLATRQEQKIPQIDRDLRSFAWRTNGDYVCYSGKAAKGIYLYNISNKETATVTENTLTGSGIFWRLSYNQSDDFSIMPELFLTKPDKNNDFYIAWEEASGIEYQNTGLDSSLVAFKRMSEISKPTNYIRKNSSKDNTQGIESVSSFGITWLESNDYSPDNSMLSAYRYKDYLEEFQFEDESPLKFFDFKDRQNKVIDERYKGGTWNKNSIQTKDYVVWVPMDVRDGEEINLRYMKIR